MYTTLNQIREYSPCESGWKKLLTHLGKTKADDEQLSIVTILDSNGLDDALWCLRAVKGHDREIRLFAVHCARAVQHLMTDQRSRDALDVAERYANGEASEQELAASLAASLAARAASWASVDASVAASVAASLAASVDASVAASWASVAASRAASVASLAASVAARDAARAAQEKDLREMCAACEVTE